IDLRVRLADRSLRQTNPVLAVVSALLDLVEQRLTASQVLDFADREPVRRRFKFSDDDLTRLQGWIGNAGIRWGLDAAHREPFKLALAELRALLADRLAGRPTRANFRTGHLTVCTLYPMRSVPHRVVCLLGLDDGAFPRKAPRDGDDLMLEEPHIGERDPRSEDRQLLLDALLAATDNLVITYAGNDERTNIRRPPAVPVGELLDV